ncbi:MAG: hypothetical protein Q7J54_05565 [Candidatus Woesearchaeota archaeon]|nr:hypothetical protein [Candidatus Woesearchaeota archaeon]
MLNKKSQITAFMIVGLILVIAAGTLIYFISLQAKAPSQTQAERVIEKVPVEMQPIKEYVEACIDKTATEALTKLGEHGGYIDPADSTLSGVNLDLDKAMSDPTSSDAVSLSSNSLNPVPYWWYLATDNKCVNCTVSSLAPSLDNVALQLSNYINRNLNPCLQDFDVFKKQGFTFNLKTIKTETTIARDNLVVYVEYPMEIAKNNITRQIKQFQTKIDIDLRKIFTIAASLAINEANNQSIESILKLLISSYGGADFNKLPPTYWRDDKFYTVTWDFTSVNQKIQQYVLPYTNLIRVNGTANATLITSPGEQGLYNALFLDALDQKYPNISVDYSYLNWNYYFDINPQPLKPVVDKQSFPITGTTQTNTYEFFYDISYPVVVTIFDKNALRNKGYRFMFALEGNLRDNKDLLEWHLGKGTIGIYDYNLVEYGINENRSSSYDVFDPTTNTTYTVTVPNVTRTLFCNENQRISGEVKIIAYNSSSYQSLEGVSITFGCGDYSACPYDATQRNLTTNKSSWVGKLPVCDGGYLLLEKDGFIPKATLLTTLPNKGANVTVEMDEFKYFNVSVKKKLVDLVNGTGIGQAQSLTSDELLIMSISKVKEDIFDQELQQVIIVDYSNATVTTDTQQIRLVPGKYEVTATYLDKRGFIIQKECKHICECWHCLCVDEKIPDRDINVTPAPLGGLYLNNNTGSWYIGSWNLYNNDNLEMYIITVPKPGCVDDMDVLGKIEEYSETYRSAIEPKFS